MKKLILTLILLFVTIMSFAQATEINTQGLTAAQKAELVIQAEKMKETPLEVTQPTVDTALKWAEVGKSVAVGIGAGARELGTAVNDFAVSPVGKVTMAIIVWKMLGKDIMAIAVSVGILLIGLPTIWFGFRKACIDKIEYEDKKGIFNRTYRAVKITKHAPSEDLIWALVISLGLSLILGLISIHIMPF
jgi:hypothetical protein